MKKLFVKGFVYFILILCILEVYVRVFHLTKDYPTRYVDEYNVEKWVPNQEGISVTGNRRQNFSKYYINNSGYNSYREFVPAADKVEIALVGDSFIEGFHQHYYNSIGKKIENRLKGVEVYEYGYAGYDLADQLHLINKYQSQFDLIDHVILGFKFENDLTRGEYSIMPERMKLEQPLYRNLRKIKLLVYLQSIGALDAPRDLVGKLVSLLKRKDRSKENRVVDKEEKNELEQLYLLNFESLINTYGFDKKRFKFLLNSKNTPQSFLKYLDKNGYNYIDYSEIDESTRPTTLIYDMHWNNRGRSIIADIIVDNFKKE
ncbi:hypothetical protein [Changchengzhania lutea]|uniref:hypothetical protein n=1 Tax=Changchengzhania lutea TaxID=2049305 RepID=UPI00115C96EA|nr:hypothetical protein [Changchengzhania lutea]